MSREIFFALVLPGRGECAGFQHLRSEIDAGALVTIDAVNSRVRILPLA